MIQVKTTSRNRQWSPNLRNRVGDPVQFENKTWINKTGKNSQPGSGYDWELLKSDIPVNIQKYGKMLVFKIETNLNELEQEVGDFCQGFVEGQFISADYLGGNKLLLTSYDI